MAMSDAAKKAIWVRVLAEDLGVTQKETTLHYDKKCAGCLSLEAGLHRRTEHVDVRHYLICDCISSGKIVINYTPTHKMLADVLTKPLGKVKHQEAVGFLGMV